MTGHMHHVHLLIRGRVQGVGFRWFAAREAARLGVAGTVRNRRDGSVEVVAEGERGRLMELVQAVRAGPPSARVTGVEEDWSEGPAQRAGFHIGDEGE